MSRGNCLKLCGKVSEVVVEWWCEKLLKSLKRLAAAVAAVGKRGVSTCGVRKGEARLWNSKEEIYRLKIYNSRSYRRFPHSLLLQLLNN